MLLAAIVATRSHQVIENFDVKPMIKSGLVIYTARLEPLAKFYRCVFKLNKREGDQTFVALDSPFFELVLLITEAAKTNHTSSPTKPRESSAMKPVFFVNDFIQIIREKIIEHGGHCNPEEKEWIFDNLIVCDGWDIEDNIFQIRSKNR